MRHCAAILLLIAMLAACSPAPAPPTRQEQTVDGLTIGLEAAEQARINTAQEFIITLADAEGRPIADAEVYLDLIMPAMPMGSNQPVATAEGAGRYRAQTAYTMSGIWEIGVVVEVATREYRATFEREVIE